MASLVEDPPMPAALRPHGGEILAIPLGASLLLFMGLYLCYCSRVRRHNFILKLEAQGRLAATYGAGPSHQQRRGAQDPGTEAGVSVGLSSSRRRTFRSAGDEGESLLGAGAAASTPRGVLFAARASRRTTQGASASRGNGYGAAATSEWPCPRCTFLNPVASATCAVCNAQRPARASAAPAAAGFARMLSASSIGRLSEGDLADGSSDGAAASGSAAAAGASGRRQALAVRRANTLSLHEGAGLRWRRVPNRRGGKDGDWHWARQGTDGEVEAAAAAASASASVPVDAAGGAFVRMINLDGTLAMVDAEEARAFELEQKRAQAVSSRARAAAAASASSSSRGIPSGPTPEFLMMVQPSVEEVIRSIRDTDIFGAMALPFEEKAQWFASQTSKLRLGVDAGRKLLAVRRDDLATSSAAALRMLKPRECRMTWRVRFEGEAGESLARFWCAAAV